jgi:hypothetical protein
MREKEMERKEKGMENKYVHAVDTNTSVEPCDRWY